MTLDLLQLTEKVKALAIEAGGFIREERNRFNRNAVEKKHAHDYVSYVDKESEKKNCNLPEGIASTGRFYCGRRTWKPVYRPALLLAGRSVGRDNQLHPQQCSLLCQHCLAQP